MRAIRARDPALGVLGLATRRVAPGRSPSLPSPRVVLWHVLSCSDGMVAAFGRTDMLGVLGLATRRVAPGRSPSLPSPRVFF